MRLTLRSASIGIASVCGVIVFIAMFMSGEIPIIAARKGGERLVVILDIGHGGRDPGATVRLPSESGRSSGKLLHEHAVVYDIGVRLLKSLRKERRIEVIPTVIISRDAVSSDQPVPDLPATCSLATAPPCDLGEEHTRTAVNLRWMLANSAYRRVLKRKGRLPTVAFISIHVDVRETGAGAAVFLPPPLPADPSLPNARPYVRYSEGREHMSLRPIEASGNHQRVSSTLARMLLRSLRKHGVDLDDDDPVRRYSAREGEVPAVLDYNRIPARVLLEVANMRDLADQQRLIAPDYRQRVADAITEALLEYRSRAGKGQEESVQDSVIADAGGGLK